MTQSKPFARGALARAMLAMLALLALSAAPLPEAGAQWSTVHEQFYLQASHNWKFRDRYQAADRMFNAFDYGHAILYETLWTKPSAPTSALEVEEYDYLTKKVLVNPPRLPLEEGAIEIAYVKMAPEAKAMFEWAHVLHRQMYDVLADERLSDARKDAEVARLLAYYKTRPDVAFSSKPKSMDLMQEQPYSLAFRQKYPKFNGLIWAYHWLQVGLYEPLVVNTTSDARQAGVRATVARFWQMLDDAPRKMPYQMPMTSAVAPKFAARYPEAAIIFDNLHSMHDVISDVLANPSVSRDRKRAEILRAARLYRDDTSYVMPVQAWLTMSREMGVENMGGPSVGFLPDPPKPTVTYGAVMEHDEQTGKMVGMKVGQMTGAMAGMDHSRMNMGGSRDTTRRTADHAAMGHGTAGSSGTAAGAGAAGAGAAPGITASMMDMHMRMLADTGIRRHMLADTALRRMSVEMLPMMPADHRAHVEAMLRDTVRASTPRATTRSTVRTPARAATGRTAPRTAPKAAAKAPATAPARTPPSKPPVARPADPHAGHKMP